MSASPGRAELLDTLIDEVRMLLHRLKVTAEGLHGLGEPSAAQRGVLRDLAESGPQTVPAMARKRPVSRQHIQTVVNGLLEAGLVRLVDNPAHRRSHLVSLTDRGAELVRTMKAREQTLLEALDLAAGDEELQTACRVLAELRGRLASDQAAAAARRVRARSEDARAASPVEPA